MTGLYNVLEKMHAGRPLTQAERDVHDVGQVSVMRRLQDEIDDAVADAYGWPRDLTPPEIVTRVVTLNLERQAEEAAGHCQRMARPSFGRTGLLGESEETREPEACRSR